MKRFGNIALFVLVVIISAVVTFWFVNRNNVSYPPSAEQHLAQLDQFEGETADEKFEYILGRFIRDVGEEAHEYRKQRKVLPRLVSPQAMTSPDYIAENKALMESTIQSLRGQMMTVMGVFDRAQEEVDLLLTYQDEETVADIRGRWQALKEKETVRYVDFFSYEEDFYIAYQQLMDFYAENAQEISYDEEQQALVFEDPADAVREEELVQELDEIAAEQKAALQQG